MSMKSILAERIKLISPTREELLRLSGLAKDFIASLKKKGIDAKVGGSLAKGTMVRKEGKQDIDIFAIFKNSEDTLNLEKVLNKISLCGELKKVHGSRDYFRVYCESAVLEIIPVVKNINPKLAENITDISLRHVKYVSQEIKKNPQIADEIRLAKSFCIANRCYGAEGYVRGFSGYSLELLVIYFGGFVKFLKGVQKKKIIDPLKYFKNSREILTELNMSKLDGPLILIDPTYKYRNVSAGLGLETFLNFVETAKNFLKSPSPGFFEKKEIDIEGMKKFAIGKGAKFVEVNLSTDRQEGDIAGTKMKKVFDFFERELIRKQQEILAKEFDYSGGQDAKGYLVVREKGEVEVRGPPKGLDSAIEKFKEAKKGAFFKKGFWWCKEKVSIENVFDLVKSVGEEMGASGELS